MTTVRPIFLYDGVRTPFGKYRGALATLSARELGSCAIAELVRRHGIASRLDGVLMGVVVQAGLGQNPARAAALHAGVDATTPGITLNNVCLASLEAACDASRRIACGEGDAFLVGGFDSMSNAPRLLPATAGSTADSSTVDGVSALLHDGLTCALAGVSQGVLSDRCNAELDISREAQDVYAAASQQRAAAAAGWRAEVELIDVALPTGTVCADQGIRAGTTAAALAALPPAFTPDGTITAGNASQMADGASAGLIVSDTFLRHADRTPLARIVDWAWIAGPDPTLHLKPALAIERLLERRHLCAADVDLYEINEAFAGVVLATVRALRLPLDVVNPHGGAVALGHPLGATGFRLLLTLALALRRGHGRRGIAALCGGGGQGLAILIETV